VLKSKYINPDILYQTKLILQFLMRPILNVNMLKNIEAPLIGEWLLNRIYFQDKKLRDFGYTILYTNSGSRLWIS